MPAPDDWNSGVLPHTPLAEVLPGVWTVTGTNPSMPLKRNMTVGRLADGRLFLHSVVALDDAGMAKLESLGDIALLVVPSAGHRMDIARYKKRYPNAKVLAPAAARAKVEELCPVDATCEDGLAGVVTVHSIPGLPNELAYELDVPGGRALVVNDVLGHGAPGPGFGGWVMGLLGPPGGRLGTPRIVRTLQVKDRASVGGWIAGLAKRSDVRALTMSHGDPITGDVAAALGGAVGNV